MLSLQQKIFAKMTFRKPHSDSYQLTVAEFYRRINANTNHYQYHVRHLLQAALWMAKQMICSDKYPAAIVNWSLIDAPLEIE